MSSLWRTFIVVRRLLNGQPWNPLVSGLLNANEKEETRRFSGNLTVRDSSGCVMKTEGWRQTGVFWFFLKNRLTVSDSWSIAPVYRCLDDLKKVKNTGNGQGGGRDRY